MRELIYWNEMKSYANYVCVSSFDAPVMHSTKFYRKKLRVGSCGGSLMVLNCWWI